MKNDTMEAGIDTICYACTLTSDQKDRILHENKRKSKGFRTEVRDYWKGRFVYTYSGWAGVRLRLRRSGEAAPRELEVIAHPARVLGNPDRSALYVPQKGQLPGVPPPRGCMVGRGSGSVCAEGNAGAPGGLHAKPLLFGCGTGPGLSPDFEKEPGTAPLPGGAVPGGRREDPGCPGGQPALLQAKLQIRRFFAYDKTAQLAMLGEEGRS